MVSSSPQTSKSSVLFLRTVPRAATTTGITVTFKFHIFVSSQAISLFAFFNFTVWSAETAKSTIQQVPFFLLTISESGRLAELKWSVCVSKSLRASSLFLLTISESGRLAELKWSVCVSKSLRISAFLSPGRILIFCWLSLSLVVWPSWNDLFVSQNHWEQVPFFCWLSLSLVVWPSWNDLFVSQNH